VSPVNPGRRPLFAKPRRLLVLLLDVALFLIAYAGAFLIRADLQPYPAAWRHFDRLGRASPYGRLLSAR